MNKEIEYFQNHLARLHVKLLIDLENKDSLTAEKTKERITRAEKELDILLGK